MLAQYQEDKAKRENLQIRTSNPVMGIDQPADYVMFQFYLTRIQCTKLLFKLLDKTLL